ncbi:Polyphosphate kinase [Pseudonocardia dioxanivorans CB1190]|uniref:Polyphosphate kinase n=1 Tax=Pseudonocardia dioxanivorans (strain ATCC 55486 / DSM 44775 / JCM 13855 / CB1190) TaxID=675635 RepID=F4CR12_PSEUX|nr:RNA degradosome polyphosphate kinase [Pseudonocardia dioxanivorans]AEA24070.1 Polyphosphate kinase [Pseudonocardia dioxanivorans CB1190]GJF07495.1 polyphosphate kinase [Pseudonocardia sp. D17]
MSVSAARPPEWGTISTVSDDARTPDPATPDNHAAEGARGSGSRARGRASARRAPRPSSRRVSADTSQPAAPAQPGGGGRARGTASRRTAAATTAPSSTHATAATSTPAVPPQAASTTATTPPGAAPIGPPAPTTAPLAATTPLPDDRYLNRELSWLDFNARVLALAEDTSQPLLERAKFLAIFASNLDEFYMVRVAGLKRRDETGLSVRSADGLTPREQLARITARSQVLAEAHARVFLDEVRPELDEYDIHIRRWADLSDEQRERLSNYFTDQVFPVLTPLAVDPAHPFPYISGLSLNLAVTVRDPEGRTERFARVKVPNNVPRLVRVAPDQSTDQGAGDPGITFLPIEDLIAAHLGKLFTGMDVAEVHAFRVTRNADLEVEEDRDEDLLQALERELARRRFGPPVRLEVVDTMSEHVLELLLRELDVDPGDVVTVPGLLDLTCLWEVYGVDRPDLKDEPFRPATHPAFAERETPRSIFSTLREGDVMVHHPYDSFSTSVQRFIEQAAADPDVLAIKQTLYRTSGDSPIVDALVDAAAAGKQVVALVEIKARFDEQANIRWARELEKAGVHVVYGLVGLKTHCKTSLVVRQEGAQIRRYCHIGTGNYHPKTARLYEDIGVLTADPTIGADLTDLFNTLTGYSRQTSYRSLLVAPYGVRRGIVRRIEDEIDAFREGDAAARVRIKVNSLVDEQVIDALYRASQAGVPVDVVVRGICAIRPGREGLSENIRVRSILGRFLEHSRIFHFGAADEYWIGSADMMHRNLDRRVEVLLRVADPRLATQLGDVFDSCLDPATRCWTLQADGSWEPSPPPGSDVDRVRDHQAEMMELHAAAAVSSDGE